MILFFFKANDNNDDNEDKSEKRIKTFSEKGKEISSSKIKVIALFIYII